MRHVHFSSRTLCLFSQMFKPKSVARGKWEANVRARTREKAKKQKVRAKKKDRNFEVRGRRKEMEWISEDEKRPVHQVGREKKVKRQKTHWAVAQMQNHKATLRTLLSERGRLGETSQIPFPQWSVKRILRAIAESGVIDVEKHLVLYWSILEEEIESKMPYRFWSWNWISTFGHTLPTRDVVRQLKQCIPPNLKAISVGGGVALWERVLWSHFNHLDVVDPEGWASWSWMPIIRAHAEEFDWKKNQYNVLMLLWPDPTYDYDLYSLQAFEGNYLIFVGLGHQIMKQWFPVPTVQGPRMMWGVGTPGFIDEVVRKWTMLLSIALPSRIEIGYQPILYVFQRMSGQNSDC